RRGGERWNTAAGHRDRYARTRRVLHLARRGVLREHRRIRPTPQPPDVLGARAQRGRAPRTAAACRHSEISLVEPSNHTMLQTDSAVHADPVASLTAGPTQEGPLTYPSNRAIIAARRKTPGSARIAVIGDSMAYAAGMEYR